MAGDTAAYAGAPVARVRLKPDIYRTTDGKVIVEDELLHFLSVKMRTLSQDEIVLLAANNFDSDWIEASKKTLFEICPSNQRNIVHKGAQKDANNIKSCLKVLNECGENIPRFVSHYLEELPPVNFSNMDVCGLLRKLEQVHCDVSAMKLAIERQTEISECLRGTTADVTRRVGALEQHSGNGHSGSVAPVKRPEATNIDHVANISSAGVTDSLAVGTETLEDRHRGELQRVKLHTMESPTPTHSPGLLKWSDAVRKGKRKRTEDYQHGPHIGKSSLRQKKAGKTIVGTGAAGGIKMITTKRVSVFASRFSPDIDAEVLRSHLASKLGQVACERIATVNTRYASFKVSAECKDIGDIYNPELWPEGTYVRRFYEPRKNGITDNVATSAAGATGALATDARG